eukprot:TRINITY_DN2381_c0_g1_i3.p1 TRINITY_DN2381_c0_g1~~TRINITY_DN2381_c0_g1_i3.p1  ORF type:complete len:129 (-),score=25.84 TRINITY_DN2381_c0_g1_i3:252-638(-)
MISDKRYRTWGLGSGSIVQSLPFDYESRRNTTRSSLPDVNSEKHFHLPSTTKYNWSTTDVKNTGLSTFHPPPYHRHFSNRTSRTMRKEKEPEYNSEVRRDVKKIRLEIKQLERRLDEAMERRGKSEEI